MCLTVKKDQEPNMATHDIVCYKHLNVKSDYLMTPFQCCRVEIGNLYVSKLDRPKKAKFGERYKISVGLHSCSLISDLDRDFFPYHIINRHYVIVECVIPKGTFYYVGEYNDTLGYASASIKYIKEISAKEYIESVIAENGSIDVGNHTSVKTYDQVIEFYKKERLCV